GQPLADVGLPAPGERAQAVERLARRDAHEVRPRVADLGVVDAGPAQPRLLHDVVGVGRRAEHLVGHREEEAAVGREGVVVVVHAEEANLADAGARGKAHSAENSSDSMPRAMLLRVERLAKATMAVSSMSVSAPSCSSRRADSSSVTSGGVALIASAYSSTSRSSGVNTVDSRQRGIWLALASSSPALWTWK